VETLCALVFVAYSALASRAPAAPAQLVCPWSVDPVVCSDPACGCGWIVEPDGAGGACMRLVAWCL
jgi:hypothetical protein